MLKNVSFPRKILYVEDDLTIRNLVVRILQRSYNIDTADSAEEATKKIKEIYYHLFLLDINLGPGMDGIELMKEIRKYSGYKSTPVIAITAYASYGTKEYFLTQDFNYYISKPFVNAEFVGIVNGALNSDSNLPE